jgi:hypothetical protein
MNKEDTEKAMDEIIRLTKTCGFFVTQLKETTEEVVALKAEAKKKDEMIDALIDELEGDTKTDQTFILIEKARELIY